ncbi:TetR/AcrR family transcriptional regulator [Rhodococcus sp. APC 3903]|uniref:TetR/AcrR family transcriptional regulator n=1 Tax=Rhodococcus sp. APC 3903 TaxID=3035193 RepID=UPI0025B58D0D|nr:TetR/AcrR family transcriptional regulator [Rhodococcus sp. APC 3903]MDN3460658.1 TetR/AcrR family transcriptional regulator [Rhodococcus sp. APC 3903]
MSSTRTREPQQERGIATRLKLLDAAIVCLAELGWRDTTVTVVTQRAGVSRGAVQHYFNDRDGLFAAAVEHVADTRLAELRLRTSALPTGKGRTLAIVDGLVDLHLGELFGATLQLCVAASADPVLRPKVAAMEDQMGRQLFFAAMELLALDPDDATARTTIQAFLDSARGLGLASFIADDSVRRKGVIRRWAELIETTSTAAG